MADTDPVVAARTDAIAGTAHRKRKAHGDGDADGDDGVHHDLFDAPIVTDRDAPSLRDVEAHLVERKKQELLAKYA